MSACLSFEAKVDASAILPTKLFHSYSALYIEINKCLEMVLVFLLITVSNQCLSFEAKVNTNAILPACFI